MKHVLTILSLIVCIFGPDYTQAVGNTEKLPLRVRMVLIKANPLLEKGNYQKAAELLSSYKAKSSTPKDTVHNHPEINFVLGNCYLQIDQLEKARECYLQAVNHNPKHRGAWQNLAKTEYELGNHVEASSAFLQCYHLSEPKEPKLLYYGAVSLLFANQYESSLVHFNTLLADHPEAVSLQWRENLVYCLMQLEKHRQALSHIIELANGFTGKKQRRWREILLQQYLALDMKKEALGLAQSLTRSEPTEAVWWKALAHIQLQYERYQKSLAALTIYSFLTPMTREEEKLLGDLYLQAGIPKKAVVNFENCNKKKFDKQTMLSLVRSYIDLDRTELALEKILTLPAKESGQNVKMLHGEILYTRKEFDKAADVYLGAAEEKGIHSSRALLMAGYSYWQLGERVQAKECFRKASRSKQNRKEAQRALQQLDKVVSISQG